MNQNQTQSSSNVRMKTKIGYREPRKYRVFIFDDDYTALDFVIKVLKLVFFKTDVEANTIAARAQANGNTVVGEYPLDIARSKVTRATEMALAANYPLKFEIEEDGHN